MNGTLLVAAITAVTLFSPEMAPIPDAREDTHCVVDVIGERTDGELIVSGHAAM